MAACFFGVPGSPPTVTGRDFLFAANADSSQSMRRGSNGRS